MFNKGDKVTVLDDAMDGIVTAVSGDAITVMTTDGFELKFQSKELLKIEGDEMKLGIGNTPVSLILKEKEIFLDNQKNEVLSSLEELHQKSTLLYEKEAGLRAILNFGHTFGHAIEAGMGYGNWLHGEAVAVGMLMAADLSVRLGLMPADFPVRLQNLIAQAGLPAQAPYMAIDDFFAHMAVDKKAEAGQIKFVVIEGLGKASIRTAPRELVQQAILAYMAAKA